MLKRWMLTVLLAAGTAGLATWAVAAAESKEKEEEDTKITMDQVPAKAQETIKKLAGDAAIKSVSKEDEDGAVAYEAGWTAGGQKHEVAVTAEGALLSTEETVDSKDVPEAVRKAVEKLLPGAEKVVFEKETKIEYEVNGIVNGKKKKVELTAAGTTAENEEGDEAKEAHEKGAKEHSEK